MKFSAERQPLLAAILKASAPIKRGDVAVLNCVRIEAADRLSITGSCRTIEVCAESKAAITETGTCLANAADIKAVVTAAPKDSALTFTTTETSLAISGKGVSVKLMTIDTASFPQMTPETGDEVINAMGAVSLCAPFASTDETRFNIRGVCIDKGSAVATDGMRIASVEIQCSRSGAIIPLEAIPVIKKLAGATGRLWVGEATWRIEAEGVKACGRLVDGAFPDNWRSLIRTGADLLTVNAALLLTALQASTLGRAKQVVLSSGVAGVTLSGDRFDGVHIESHIDCDALIEAEFTVVLSAAKMQSTLDAIGDVEISISTYDGKLRLDASNGLTAAMTVLLDQRTSLPEAETAA